MDDLFESVIGAAEVGLQHVDVNLKDAVLEGRSVDQCRFEGVEVGLIFECRFSKPQYRNAISGLQGTRNYINWKTKITHQSIRSKTRRRPYACSNSLESSCAGIAVLRRSLIQENAPHAQLRYRGVL